MVEFVVHMEGFKFYPSVAKRVKRALGILLSFKNCVCFMYIGVLSACVCVPHACLVPSEARRGP